MADKKNVFNLKFEGDDISPTNVRMSMLFRVFDGLERAVEAMATELGIAFGESEAIFAPQAFQKSSLVILGTINAKALDPILAIDRAFYRDELESLPPAVRNELRGVQSTLASREIRLEMTGDALGLKGVSLSKDRPQIPDPKEDVLDMSSHAVIYGVCMRVNRKRRDAAIELHDGQSCTLSGLSDEQLQVLMQAAGKNLEQVFRVEGEASWNLEDYRIKTIEVSSITSIERNTGELFDALQEAVGDSYDGVDPIAYVNELRRL